MKPKNAEIRDIFDTVASRYDSVTNSYALSRRIEFILRYAKGDCLEVGTGAGEIARALASKHKITATDISPNMVSEARKKGIEAVDTHNSFLLL